VALWLYARRHLELVRTRDVARFIPDVLRLVKGLSIDRTVPLSARIRLFILVAYLAWPIDLVPDFLPVVGLADDLLVLAIALRSVVRRAGADAVDRHWPGTVEGLQLVRRIAGLA
jgi:uncharacterized membrane protein YkvA (DUF1232 family)